MDILFVSATQGELPFWADTVGDFIVASGARRLPTYPSPPRPPPKGPAGYLRRSFAFSASRGSQLTALTPGMNPTNQPCTCLKRQTARGCSPGQPGASGTSWTSTGRLAGVSMADGRSPQETRAWLSGRRLARGRDLPARLNFGSDLVHFSDAADQSAISAGIRPV